MIAALARQRQGPQTSAPGPGDNAGAMGKLQQCVQMIQQAALGLQPGTPLHKDCLQAAQRLSRHLPQGAPTAGVQMTDMRDTLRRIMQGGFLPQILQQLAQRGDQGGGTAGAAPNLAPNPSMPLPGA